MKIYLLLLQLVFLRLDELFRHTVGAGLGAQQQVPEFLAEGRGVGFKKSSELDL